MVGQTETEVPHEQALRGGDALLLQKRGNVALTDRDGTAQPPFAQAVRTLTAAERQQLALGVTLRIAPDRSSSCKDATTSSLCIRSYSCSAIRTTSQLFLLRAYHNSLHKSSFRLLCDLTVCFFSGRNARFDTGQLFAEGLKLLANGRAFILRVLPARRRAAGDIVRGAFRPRLFF